MFQNRFLNPFIALLITIGVTTYFSGRAMPIVVEKRLVNLPYQVGTWAGNDFSFDQLIIDELDADISISRNYIDNGNTHRITLYIGYYGTQKGGRTGHNPNSCYPSSGWRILSDKKTNITDNDSVNRLSISKGEAKQVVYHWYQNRKKILKTGLEQNINRFIDRVLYNSNEGAFVRISIDSRTEGAEEALRQFGILIVPKIAKNWPIEKDV